MNPCKWYEKAQPEAEHYNYRINFQHQEVVVMCLAALHSQKIVEGVFVSLIVVVVDEIVAAVVAAVERAAASPRA